MKKSTMMVNTLLAVVVGIGLMVGMIWRTCIPNVVLPEFDVIAMVGLTLIALVLEYYLAGKVERNWLLQIILAAVTFGGLGMAAGVAGVGVNTFIVGAAVFAVLAFVFDSMVRRLEVTTNKKCAVIPTAFVLYLAFQCFAGMF